MMDALLDFIVEAKSKTYVGDNVPSAACRPASHDIAYERGAWRYLDSYFGGTDFLRQEVVWWKGEPVWAMNYYGRVLMPDLIDAVVAGTVIRDALSALYRTGRFLGEYDHRSGIYDYTDRSTTNLESFIGIERIHVGENEVYRLDYHGGLIKP
ncbi:DUF5680 domain-containing protein [Rhizobium sp. Leaf371]|uniref:DUF5680 domain-containing protein n=1 Tax=Rhizobium sp. Leaf371 TaxID=1736355 RepID=UPI0019101188|nr:DUF5680 domain-containing protein [Rhizobium sp. Leaf371]